MRVGQPGQLINFSERLLQRFNRSYRPEKPKGSIAEAYVEFIFSRARGSIEREPLLRGQRPDLIWKVVPDEPNTWEFLIEVLYGYETEQSIRGLAEKVKKYDVAAPQVYVVALVYDCGVDVERIKHDAAFSINLALAISNDNTLPERERVKTTESFTPGAFDSGHAHGIMLIPFPPPTNNTVQWPLTFEVLTLNSEQKPHNVMDIFTLLLRDELEHKTLHL